MYVCQVVRPRAPRDAREAGRVWPGAVSPRVLRAVRPAAQRGDGNEVRGYRAACERTQQFEFL